jgi:hypothetical protein
MTLSERALYHQIHPVKLASSVAIMGVGGAVIAAAWLRGWILEGMANDTAT